MTLRAAADLVRDRRGRPVWPHRAIRPGGEVHSIDAHPGRQRSGRPGGDPEHLTPFGARCRLRTGRWIPGHSDVASN